MAYTGFLTALMASALMASSVLTAWAEDRRPEWKAGGHHERDVTPYGDFCPRCSKYGVAKGRNEIGNKEALDAMRAYFHHRGFRVEIVDMRGRFIIAHVYRGPELVDKVVFDRRSGRIRSIY